jgi:exosortase/archaeosortase family protein
LKVIKENFLYFFFFKLFLIWLSWKGIINLLGQEYVPINERKIPILSAKWEYLNDLLADFLIQQNSSILNILGYKNYVSGRISWIEGYGGVAVGNYCLGFQLMYYFIMLMMVSEVNWQKKLIGVFLGVITTQLLNIVRIIGLNLITVYAPDLMFLSHDLFFNILVFGVLISFYYYIVKDI